MSTTHHSHFRDTASYFCREAVPFSECHPGDTATIQVTGRGAFRAVYEFQTTCIAVFRLLHPKHPAGAEQRRFTFIEFDLDVDGGLRWHRDKVKIKEIEKRRV